jgi:hypothetical protein
MPMALAIERRVVSVSSPQLLRGVRLPGGRIVGEANRVVHLFPIPLGSWCLRRCALSTVW